MSTETFVRKLQENEIEDSISAFKSVLAEMLEEKKQELKMSVLEDAGFIKEEKDDEEEEEEKEVSEEEDDDGEEDDDKGEEKDE